MQKNKLTVVSKANLIPFVLITSLFALWGFANDITYPLVAAFATLMEISNAKAALVQFAFYGGYATMAIPAALFVRKYSYKKGILFGLGLYAVGALLFFPAAKYQAFGFFLISLYVLTFGLAFLETTANPFILSMGDEKTATRRLNLAQAFNPFGSLLGMFVASQFILSNLQSDQRDAAGNVLYTTLELSEKAAIKTHDLEVIRDPYVILGFVVIVMLLLIGGAKIPENETKPKDLNTAQSFRNLIKNKKYREGVIAQMFYVGAQIMCWTFIIQYAHALGIYKAAAQNFNILAMVIFLTSRFVSTFLMQYVNSKKLLMLFGIGGAMTLSITIFSQGMLGLYALVATSGFMSLMFPTIYGIALEGLGEDASLGAAGLVMAIVGGALMPPLQGLIIDMGTVGTLQAVNASFVLPLICFCVVTIYGYRSLQIHQSV